MYCVPPFSSCDTPRIQANHIYIYRRGPRLWYGMCTVSLCKKICDKLLLLFVATTASAASTPTYVAFNTSYSSKQTHMRILQETHISVALLYNAVPLKISIPGLA